MSLPFLFMNASTKPRRTALQSTVPSSKTRIGIVGGGIAGVTAAHSLAKRLNKDVNIVVMEADSSQPSQSVAKGKPPEWIAATARNANSLVPGAAMHLMAQKGTLYQVMKDTLEEWIMVYVEGFQMLFDKTPLFTNNDTVKAPRTLSIDNFENPPPYFALHLIRCLGLSASMDERWSFLRFIWHFLAVSFFRGDEADMRAACLVQLAKANRAAVESAIDKDGLASQVGLSNGFLSLHRTLAKAQMTVEECKKYGQEAHLLSWEEVTKLERRLERLPIKPLFAVHRSQDKSASCENFVKHLIEKCSALGIEYWRDKTAKISNLEVIKGNDSKNIFRVTSIDGAQEDFDVLILAAGINTPLLAAKLGAGSACPTYPLRGYSLTVFTPELGGFDATRPNLLSQPFSVDSMYCSSVNPRMARFAGFGELVGYRDKAVHVPSVGPRVLARYAQSIFPDAAVSEDNALQCFRALSPDDIPLAGEVSSVPGLFLHTGHGTLGWTLSLATAECVAQAVSDRLGAEESSLKTFVLPDDSVIERKVLSPDRFA
jgi:D-amino-acid dehydrogenase